jgi:hypothetical protein
MGTLGKMLLLGAGLLTMSTAAAQTGMNERDTSAFDRNENRRMVRQAGTSAQGENTWTFGPKIGLNASSFSNSSAEHRLGPSAGVFFVYSHREHLGINGDLLYSYKGAEQETHSGNTKTKRSTQLSYIEMPVQGMYYFCPESRFRPKVGLGPYAAVLVDGEEQVKTEIDRDGIDPSMESETDVRHYSTFDWGVVATTGFNYELMDDTWLNVDMRYGHGFSDIADRNGAVDIKNRNWAMQVGLGFPLNRK